MKLTRPAIAVALGTALIVTGSAQAKVKPKPPKPVCNLLTDAPGDAALIGPPAPDPSNDALDILSADVAADAKNVTAVIRVKKLAKTAPTFAPTGIQWRVGFTADDVVFSMAAHTNALGTEVYDASYKTTVGGSLYSGGVTGQFDLAKNEIHITAPTSLFSAQATIKPGKVLSALTANTYIDVVVPDATGKFGGGTFASDGLGIDSGTSDKTYKVGTLSCVTPGK